MYSILTQSYGISWVDIAVWLGGLLVAVLLALHWLIRPAWNLTGRALYEDAPSFFRHVRSLYDLAGVFLCLPSMLARYPAAFPVPPAARRKTTRLSGVASVASVATGRRFRDRLFRAARIRIEWDLLNGSDRPEPPVMLKLLPLAKIDPPRARKTLKVDKHEHAVALTVWRAQMYAWLQGDDHLLGATARVRACLEHRLDAGHNERAWRSPTAREAARPRGGSRPWRLRLLDWVLERRLARHLRRKLHAERDLGEARSDDASSGKTGPVAGQEPRSHAANPAPPIVVADCFAITAAAGDIKRYFNILAETARLASQRELARPYYRFLTTVRVENGFVAPMHLLGGVLHEFEEDWAPAIRQYGIELSAWLPRQLPTRDLARLQGFQFNCWLSWGPSIPVCSCAQWHGWREQSVYQYGYGDESNSFSLLVEDANERDRLLQRFTANHAGRGTRDAAPLLAVPRSLDANIRWAPALDPRSPAQRSSFRHKDRLVLALIPGEDKAAPGGGRYYSAYVWIMFLLCKGANSVEPATGKSWSSLLPLFEHANIADPDTYLAVKRRLARKVRHTIAHLLETNRELVIRYACAFDDPNCTAVDLDSADESRWRPGMPVCRALSDQPVRQLLATEIEAAEPKARSNLDRLMLDFRGLSNSQIGAFRSFYSACNLPKRVDEYLETLGQTAEDARSNGRRGV